MPIRNPIRIALAGLALGLLFDRIVFDHPLGFGSALFVALILAALALTLSWERLAPIRQNLWIAAPLLFFGAMVAVRANGFVTFLNVVSVLLLLGVVAVFFLREPLTEINAARPGAVAAAGAGDGRAAGGANGPHGGDRGVAGVAGRPGQSVAAAGARVPAGQPGRDHLCRAALVCRPHVRRGAAPASARRLPRRSSGASWSTVRSRSVVGFFLLGGLAYMVWREERTNRTRSPCSSVAYRPCWG